MLVQRQPLAVLAAESLRAGIATGAWAQKLPGENRLAAELGVSRSTLRMALKILAREGLVANGGGNRTSVIAGAAREASRQPVHTVNVLLPFPFAGLPNFALFWITELRNLCHASGRTLHLISSRAFYRERVGKVREQLVQQHPAACWVLAFSNADVQGWFQQRGIPTVIGGRPSPGINLPSVSVNGHATMFHLLGRLTALGHRRVALVTGGRRSTTPMIFRSAFEDTCRKLGPAKVEPELITIADNEPDAVGREILLALRRKNGPTALVIFNPLNVVAAFSYLPAHGVSIPRDVSIVTTFGDSYLGHLHPTPFRYRFNANAYARKLLSLIQKWEMGMSSSELQAKFMLDPVEGKSIGKPRKAALREAV